ncbi:MAG: helix-turn-helix domain-containing protein [Chromatiales bacterium]|jgi:DNA-binding HxlR family transcriptional regulator|nr:helix-turn-helix domain-containing protein [Chromatiales bacterium]MDX9766967.1 helix-turn-helix domain-containing protein [Ectothiorhodospiraceae bacterium]
MKRDKPSAAHRSRCPLTAALDLIGDKWTLVILRDVMEGKHRYGEIQASPENIPTNILSNRLRRLVEEGIIEKHAYQERPLRHAYTLTQKGADLLPVLQQAARWGQKYVSNCDTPPDWFFRAKPKDVLGRQQTDRRRRS